MIYKNTKAMICSADSNTDFFDIVTDFARWNNATIFDHTPLGVRTADVNGSNNRQLFHILKRRQQTIFQKIYRGILVV